MSFLPSTFYCSSVASQVCILQTPKHNTGTFLSLKSDNQLQVMCAFDSIWNIDDTSAYRQTSYSSRHQTRIHNTSDMENTKYKSHSSFMLITVVICLRNEHVHAFVLQRFMHRNTSAPVGFPFFACDVLILKVLHSSLCTCNLCCYGISLSDFFMSFNVVGKTSFQGYTLRKWYANLTSLNLLLCRVGTYQFH